MYPGPHQLRLSCILNSLLVIMFPGPYQLITGCHVS
jgi:hypothetical protein